MRLLEYLEWEVLLVLVDAGCFFGTILFFYIKDRITAKTKEQKIEGYKRRRGLLINEG